MNGRSKALCGLYALIALGALVGTWSENLAYFVLPDNGGAFGFIQASAANPAAASIGIDLLFLAVACFVWMAVEARRLGIRFVWIYIALSLLIAIGVMFPVFLIVRQRRLSQLAERAAGG